MVDLARREERAVRLFQDLRERIGGLLVPTPVLAEFLGGSRDVEHDLAKLREAAEILSLGEDDAIAAASIGRATLDEGQFPGWVDCLIAGFARNRGELPIVTANLRRFPHSTTIGY